MVFRIIFQICSNSANFCQNNRYMLIWVTEAICYIRVTVLWHTLISISSSSSQVLRLRPNMISVMPSSSLPSTSTQSSLMSGSGTLFVLVDPWISCVREQQTNNHYNLKYLVFLHSCSMHIHLFVIWWECRLLRMFNYSIRLVIRREFSNQYIHVQSH